MFGFHCLVSLQQSTQEFIKTFDTVAQNKLSKIMLRVKISNQIIYVVYGLYTANVISVKTGSHLSDWKPIKQGCPLPLLLFNILSKWKQAKHGSLDVDLLALADDVVLFAHSEDDLQRSVVKRQETSMELNVVVSIEKTNSTTICGKFPICSQVCTYNQSAL